MAEHTPGPWKTSMLCDSVEAVLIKKTPRGQLSRVYGYAASPGTICLLEDGENINYTDADEKAANAHLIAAAPDLLAACKKALAYFDVVAARSPIELEIEEQLAAAIAKAKGE